MPPTPTLRLSLLPRQNPPPTATVTIIPDPDSSSSSSSGESSLSGGAIAGIVIGTIVGILLLIWIVRSLSGNKTHSTAAPAPDNDRQGWYDDRAGAVHGRTRSGHHHSSRSRSRDHHHHHRAHRHHSRRRSSTPRPVVVVDDKTGYGEHPRRPSGAYVVPMGEVRRSRSTGRSRSPGYYARY